MVGIRGASVDYQIVCCTKFMISHVDGCLVRGRITPMNDFDFFNSYQFEVKKDKIINDR